MAGGGMLEREGGLPDPGEAVAGELAARDRDALVRHAAGEAWAGVGIVVGADGGVSDALGAAGLVSGWWRADGRGE